MVAETLRDSNGGKVLQTYECKCSQSLNGTKDVKEGSFKSSQRGHSYLRNELQQGESRDEIVHLSPPALPLPAGASHWLIPKGKSEGKGCGAHSPGSQNRAEKGREWIWG